MRLPANVLGLLAGSVVGASLAGCGAAPQVQQQTTPVVMVATSPPVTSARLPPTNGPTPTIDYAVACGRG